MRSGLAVALVALAIARAACAQDALIGDTVVTAPIEDRPSIGLLVRATVQGHGPYRFFIQPFGPTELTPTVARAAGLIVETKGQMFAVAENQLSGDVRVKAGSVSLGDADFDIAGARVMSDRSLGSYAPVADFGGFLGAEVFQRKVVRVDLTKLTLTLSPEAGFTPPADAVELTLADGGGSREILRSLAAPVSFDGTTGLLDIGLGRGSWGFIESSRLGRALVAASPYRLAFLNWSPDGLTSLTAGVARGAVIAGVALGPTSFVRVDTPATPGRLGRLDTPPVDGSFGLQILRRFDLTIDAFAGKAWLQPRNEWWPCERKPDPLAAMPRSPPKTLGLGPWVYRGHGIVAGILRGGPADAAGIRPGDEIVSMNGADMTGYFEALDAVCERSIQTTVVFRHGAETRTVVLTPAEPIATR